MLSDSLKSKQIIKQRPEEPVQRAPLPSLTYRQSMSLMNELDKWTYPKIKLLNERDLLREKATIEYTKY